jgi:hypothetical protein
MPPIEVCDLRQKAVLWQVKGQDRHGKQILGSPSEISVRWEVSEYQVVDPTGNTLTANGSMLTNEDIENMSIVWQGKLKDLPATPTKLHQVFKANSMPSLKATQTHFEYTLMTFNDSLPTVVP